MAKLGARREIRRIPKKSRGELNDLFAVEIAGKEFG